MCNSELIHSYRVEKEGYGLNTALIIYALSVYPSIFSKYFKYGVSDVGAMLYTVDNLTEKFILKKTGHVFGMLATSIQSSYSFLKDFMEIKDSHSASALTNILAYHLGAQ